MAVFRGTLTLCGFALLWAPLHAEEPKEATPPPMPAGIVSAWRKAGAVGRDDWTFLTQSSSDPTEIRSASDFYISRAWRSDAASVPDPGRKFSLDLNQPRTGFLSEGLPRWPSLQALRIRAYELSEDDWRAITSAAGIETLSLELEATRGIEKQLGKLTELKKLRHLSIGAILFGDSALPELAKLRQLETLNLSQTSVTDQGLSALAGMNLLDLLVPVGEATDCGFRHTVAALRPDTRELSVRANLLSSTGFEALARLRSLEKLTLANASVTREAAAVFAKLTRLKHIDLASCVVAEGAIPQLAKAPSLESLDLASSTIAAFDFKCFAKGTMRALHVPENVARPERFGDWIDALHPDTDELLQHPLRPWKLDDDMLPHVAKLRKLRTLHLMTDAVTNKGLRHLRGLRLKTFSAPRDSLTDDGLEHLAAALDPDIESLRLQGTFRDATLQCLAKLKKLHTLSLDSENIADDAARIAASLPLLRSLELTSGNFSDRTLEHLANSKNLRSLLIDAGITPAGLRRLAGKNFLELNVSDTQGEAENLPLYLSTLDRNIEHLDLSNWKIGDAELAQLAPFKKLKGLGLAGTEVRGPGLKALKGVKLANCALPPEASNDIGLLAMTDVLNPDTEHLHFSAWQITDAEVGVLKKIRGLKTLDLQATLVTEAGLESLAGMRLQSLRMPNGIRSDRALSAMLEATDPELTWLILPRCTVGKKAAAVLAKRPNLRRLELQGANLEPGALPLLARCPKLRTLDLFGAQGAKDEVRCLAEMAELESLHLPAIDRPLLAALRKAPHLKRLQVADAENLASHLPALEGMQLESLNLNGLQSDEQVAQWAAAVDPHRCALPKLGQEVTAKSLPILAKLSKHGMLDLRSTAVEARDIAQLSGMGFQQLNLPAKASTPVGLKHLVAALDPDVLQLDLSGMSGLDESISEVRNLKKLRSLFVADSDLTLTGLAKLRGMNLMTLGVPEKYCDDFGVQHALAALHPDGYRTFFETHSVRLTRRGLASLPRNAGLHSLDVSEPDLSDADLEALGGLNLKTLAVKHEILTDLGVRHFLAAQCPCVISFDFSGTPITDAALEAIAKRGSVTTLVLSMTAITDAGVAHLVRMPSLQQLDIRATQLSEVGVARLRRELPGCRINFGEIE